MADPSKVGRDWQLDELDELVADYFVMLQAELAGQPYTKLRHSTLLMERIGRTHRSVKFKHQNLSAVLEELGLPLMRGYRPKRSAWPAPACASRRWGCVHSSPCTRAVK